MSVFIKMATFPNVASWALQLVSCDSDWNGYMDGWMDGWMDERV